MSVIDLEQLLQDVSAEQPCGEDLEYDAAFLELDRAAQGKPEHQMGDQVVAAEPPNWRDVRGKALELLSRTRDLRIAAHLARALVHTDGHSGLAGGTELIRGLLQRHWDKVHPQLDPEDNDPTMRVNILASLADGQGFLHDVRDAPLVRSRALGKFGLRDVEIATGKAPSPANPETPPAEIATIDGAFMECDVDELQATAEVVEHSLGHVTAIETLVTEKVGAGNAPDLSALSGALKAAHEVLADRLARRGVGEAAAAAEGAAGGAAQPLTGEINSREDVVRVLDKACDYFARHEPSSPVPLLLRRAKRLVSKDFMEIIKDLAPDGVRQAEMFKGADGED